MLLQQIKKPAFITGFLFGIPQSIINKSGAPFNFYMIYDLYRLKKSALQE